MPVGPSRAHNARRGTVPGRRIPGCAAVVSGALRTCNRIGLTRTRLHCAFCAQAQCRGMPRLGQEVCRGA